MSAVETCRIYWADSSKLNVNVTTALDRRILFLSLFPHAQCSLIQPAAPKLMFAALLKSHKCICSPRSHVGKKTVSPGHVASDLVTKAAQRWKCFPHGSRVWRRLYPSRRALHINPLREVGLHFGFLHDFFLIRLQRHSDVGASSDRSRFFLSDEQWRCEHSTCSAAQQITRFLFWTPDSQV